jgi:DNA-binding transcriptional MerR regulator
MTMAKITITHKFLREPQFRLPEALAITGVDRRRLFQWHNRGLAPEPRQTGGRGIRRLYSVRQLAHTYVLRLLADMAVPLPEAYKAAADAVDLIEEFIFLQGHTANADELEDLPDCIGLIYKNDGRWEREWFGKFGKRLPDGGIQRYMRLLNVEAAVVMDISSTSMMFFMRVIEAWGI